MILFKLCGVLTLFVALLSSGMDIFLEFSLKCFAPRPQLPLMLGFYVAIGQMLLLLWAWLPRG